MTNVRHGVLKVPQVLHSEGQVTKGGLTDCVGLNQKTDAKATSK